MYQSIFSTEMLCLYGQLHSPAFTLCFCCLGGRRSNSTSIGSLNSSFNDGASGMSTPRRSSRSRSNSVSSTRRLAAAKAKKSSEYKLEEGMTVLYNNDMGVYAVGPVCSLALTCTCSLINESFHFIFNNE